MNYFRNFDINKGLFGFSLFTTSFVNNVPTTITSGAGGLTLTPTGGGLQNKVDLQLQKTSAINTQGQGMISEVMTLNRGDLARVLRWSFMYERTAGTIDASGASTASFEIWIYDVVNNAWIQPSAFRGIVATTIPDTVFGEFQPPITATQLRLAIIYRQTDANLWAMRFDNFELQTNFQSRGAVVTDWQSYTPTGSWTTNATYTGRFRRVGDSLEVQATVSLTGPTNAATLSINLPPGVTIDTTKLTNPNTFFGAVFGSCAAKGGATAYNFQIVYATPTSVISVVQTNSGAFGAQAQLTNNFPITWTNGDNLSCNFKVPIAGWSSNVQLSSDTHTRVVAKSSYSLSAARTAGQPIAGGVVSWDTHNGYNPTTGRYTVPVSGFYTVRANGSTSVNTILQGFVNGSNVFSFMTAIAGQIFNGTSTVLLRAGDLFDIRSTNNANIDLSFQIERISGPAQIAASETVAMRATRSAGNITTSTPIDYVFNNVAFNTHAGTYDVATGIWTAPSAGIYDIVARGTSQGTAVGFSGFEIQINTGSGWFTQSVFGFAREVVGGNFNTFSGSVLFRLIAGDRVKVITSQNVSTTFVGTEPWSGLEIKRIGL